MSPTPNANNHLTTYFHAAYMRVVPAEPPLNDNRSLGKCWDKRRDLWAQLIAAGYTLSQLKFVLEYLAAKVRRKGWDDHCLSIRNVCDCDKFQECLSLGRWTEIKGGEPRCCVPPDTHKIKGYGSKKDSHMPAEPVTPRHLLPGLAKSWAEQMRKSLDES